QLLPLVGHCADDRRVRVAQRRDRDAGDEVEVLVSVDIPYPDAAAVIERKRWRAVVRHHHRTEAVGQRHELLPSAGTTIVPIPSLVKISNSNACGTRPSRTCARGTPPDTARRQA